MNGYLSEAALRFSVFSVTDQQKAQEMNRYVR